MPYSTIRSNKETYSFSAKDEPKLSIRIWPNRSLPKVGFIILMIMVWFCMSVPMIAFIGSSIFWGLLPFFIITLSLLFFLLNKSYDDGNLIEELSIWSDLIIVNRVEPNKTIKSWEANPYWSSVNLYNNRGPVEDYLTLKGNGREIELGSFLSPSERKCLHSELKRVL